MVKYEVKLQRYVSGATLDVEYYDTWEDAVVAFFDNINYWNVTKEGLVYDFYIASLYMNPWREIAEVNGYIMTDEFEPEIQMKVSKVEVDW